MSQIFRRFSEKPPKFLRFEYFAKSPVFPPRKSANSDFQKFLRKAMTFNPRFKLPNKKGGFFKMKKIITAAAVAAMAASFAAADAKFSVNYRTGIQFLEHQMKKGTTMLNSYTDNRKT